MADKKKKLNLEMSKIAIKQLVKQSAIHLPEVGSLTIELIPARLDATNKRLIPPRRRINFTSNKQGDSFVEILASSPKISNEQAAEIYSRWLKKARTPRGVMIEGVGELIDKSFVMDKGMEQILNQTMGDNMELTTPRHSLSRWMVSTLVALAVVGVLSFGGYTILKGLHNSDDKPTEQVAAVDIEKPTKEEFTPQPVVKTTVEEALVEVIEPEPQVEPKPEPKPEPKVEPKPAVQPMQMRYRVVGGVFTDAENTQEYADKYTNIEGYIVKIYPFGKSQMVSLFESPSVSACRNFIKERGEEHGSSLWIYERK